MQSDERSSLRRPSPPSAWDSFDAAATRPMSPHRDAAVASPSSDAPASAVAVDSGSALDAGGGSPGSGGGDGSIAVMAESGGDEASVGLAQRRPKCRVPGLQRGHYRS